MDELEAAIEDQNRIDADIVAIEKQIAELRDRRKVLVAQAAQISEKVSRLISTLDLDEELEQAEQVRAISRASLTDSPNAASDSVDSPVLDDESRTEQFILERDTGQQEGSPDITETLQMYDLPTTKTAYFTQTCRNTKNKLFICPLCPRCHKISGCTRQCRTHHVPYEHIHAHREEYAYVHRPEVTCSRSDYSLSTEIIPAAAVEVVEALTTLLFPPDGACKFCNRRLTCRSAVAQHYHKCVAKRDFEIAGGCRTVDELWNFMKKTEVPMPRPFAEAPDLLRSALEVILKPVTGLPRVNDSIEALPVERTDEFIRSLAKSGCTRHASNSMPNKTHFAQHLDAVKVFHQGLVLWTTKLSDAVVLRELLLQRQRESISENNPDSDIESCLHGLSAEYAVQPSNFLLASTRFLETVETNWIENFTSRGLTYGLDCSVIYTRESTKQLIRTCLHFVLNYALAVMKEPLSSLLQPEVMATVLEEYIAFRASDGVKQNTSTWASVRVRNAQESASVRDPDLLIENEEDLYSLGSVTLHVETFKDFASLLGLKIGSSGKRSIGAILTNMKKLRTSYKSDILPVLANDCAEYAREMERVLGSSSSVENRKLALFAFRSTGARPSTLLFDPKADPRISRGLRFRDLNFSFDTNGSLVLDVTERFRKDDVGNVPFTRIRPYLANGSDTCFATLTARWIDMRKGFTRPLADVISMPIALRSLGIRFELRDEFVFLSTATDHDLSISEPMTVVQFREHIMRPMAAFFHLNCHEIVVKSLRAGFAIDLGYSLLEQRMEVVSEEELVQLIATEGVWDGCVVLVYLAYGNGVFWRSVRLFNSLRELQNDRRRSPRAYHVYLAQFRNRLSPRDISDIELLADVLNDASESYVLQHCRAYSSTKAVARRRDRRRKFIVELCISMTRRVQ